LSLCGEARNCEQRTECHQANCRSHVLLPMIAPAQSPPLRRVFARFVSILNYVTGVSPPDALINADVRSRRTSSLVSTVFATAIERRRGTWRRAFDRARRPLVGARWHALSGKHDRRHTASWDLAHLGA
jgi:hypothetical protein